MLRVGLTGGIACGKSYTLREFAKLGAHTIDADAIAHQAIQPGQPAYEKIRQAFGHRILASDKTIDRKKLGTTVFSDSQAREKLNQIVHPYVFEEEERRIADFLGQKKTWRSPILIVDAALMVETGSYRKYDSLVVVYCHPAIQLQRLMRRDDLREEEALQRIAAQMPLLDKVKYADYIIENSGKLSETQQQIKQTYAELLNQYEEAQS